MNYAASARVSAELLAVVARGLETGGLSLAESNAALRQVAEQVRGLLLASSAEITTTNATGAAGLLEALERVKP